MAAKTPQYLSWRNGRPRWKAPPSLRMTDDEGNRIWPDFDLKTADGHWMSFEQACRAAGSHNARIAAWRAGEPLDGKPRHIPISTEGRTIGRLLTLYCDPKNPRWVRLAPKTQAGYRTCERIIRQTYEDVPVTALSNLVLEEYFEALHRTRGEHMAAGVARFFKLVLRHARTHRKWITFDPMDGVQIRTPQGRLRLWNQAEITAMVRHAHALELPSVADGILLGLYTGQRRADVLQISSVSRRTDGRFEVLQGKTHKRIRVPAYHQLGAAMEEIEARWKDRQVAEARLDRPETLVTMEGSGRPYTAAGHYYGKMFQLVRWAASGLLDQAPTPERIAATDDPKTRCQLETMQTFFRHRKASVLNGAMDKIRAERNDGLEACPSVLGVTFSDLRDTFVTRAAEAGCTVPEIISISGHSEQSIKVILNHYLVITDRLATNATDKIEAYIKSQGWTY